MQFFNRNQALFDDTGDEAVPVPSKVLAPASSGIPSLIAPRPTEETLAPFSAAQLLGNLQAASSSVPFLGTQPTEETLAPFSAAQLLGNLQAASSSVPFLGTSQFAQESPIANIMSQIKADVLASPQGAGISALAAPSAVSSAPSAQDIQAALAKQILASSDPTKWQGEGFGSAEKNAANMAEILSGIGITDISQFGKFASPKYQNVQLHQRSFGEPDGTEPARSEWGYFVDTGDSPTWNAATPEMLANMDASGLSKYVTDAGAEAYGNKLTKQAVGDTYGERQTGNAWGGTYAGSGNTAYRVQYDAQGNPHFYTTGASSKTDLSGLAPVLGIASLAMGLPGILGGALNAGAGLGLSAAAEAALGGALTGGAISGVTGGDVLKGAVLGGLGGYASGSGMFGGADAGAGNGAWLGEGIESGIPEWDTAVGSGLAGAPTSAMPTDIGMGGGNIGDVVVPESAAKNFFPIGGEANINLTPAAIESGLGTPGYGFNAGAAASGLFNPEAIGAGANTDFATDNVNYSNEGRNYKTPESTQGLGGSPVNASTATTNGLPGINVSGAGTSGISSLLGRAAVSALLGGGAKAAIDAAKGGSGTISDGGGGTGTGPLSGYNFNPAMYRASTPDPAMFRPGAGIVTVADQLRAQGFPQPVSNPAIFMAQGGSTKPAYTAKAKLAAMDPWSRSVAEMNNAAAMARMPTGFAAPQAGIAQLGQFAAGGGISNLGGYSDGGRMLKGPGDGVSDSIPATIGDKQPARLADGEFVIPARIVSELGNGSSDAGARELYKMMDRIQNARKKSMGKGNVAKDTKAAKQLPA